MARATATEAGRPRKSDGTAEDRTGVWPFFRGENGEDEKSMRSLAWFLLGSIDSLLIFSV